MQQAAIKILALALCGLFTSAALIGRSQAPKNRSSFAPVIPKTWDEKALARLAVPLAEAGASPVPVSADYYYRMPVPPVYKSYTLHPPPPPPPSPPPPTARAPAAAHPTPPPPPPPPEKPRLFFSRPSSSMNRK